MLIKYLGPSDFVRVVPNGRHWQNQVKEYPDDFGADLLETSTRQQFEEVDAFEFDADAAIANPPADWTTLTIDDLRKVCDRMGCKYGSRTKEASLIKLIVAKLPAASGE